MDYSVLLFAFVWCSAGLVADTAERTSIDNCNVTSALDIRENAENNIKCRDVNARADITWWIKWPTKETLFPIAFCTPSNCTLYLPGQFTVQRSPQESQLVYRQQNRTEDIGAQISCESQLPPQLGGTRQTASCELNVISPANLSSCVVEDKDSGTVKGICQFEHAFSATRDFTCKWYQTSSSDQSPTEYPGDIIKGSYTSNGQVYYRGQCSLNISGQQWNDGDYSYSIDFYPGPGRQSVPIGCLGGYYGDKCSEKCGHCKDGAVCNASNGHCLQGCQAGYEGLLCQESCPDGFYGDKCSEECSYCKDGAVCDTSNGHCPNGCQAGYAGPLCQNSCPDGFYGDSCSEKCGHCIDCAVCNASNGHCPNGCQAGYVEPLCQNTPPPAARDDDEKGQKLVGISVGVTLAGVIVGVIVFVVWLQRQQWILPCADKETRAELERRSLREPAQANGERRERYTDVYEIPDTSYGRQGNSRRIHLRDNSPAAVTPTGDNSPTTVTPTRGDNSPITESSLSLSPAGMNSSSTESSLSPAGDNSSTTVNSPPETGNNLPANNYESLRTSDMGLRSVYSALAGPDYYNTGFAAGDTGASTGAGGEARPIYEN